MPKAMDLTNKRFGRLIAIEPVKTKTSRAWRCICDCGNFVDVITASLRNNGTRSCGCLMSDTTIRNNKKKKKTYDTKSPTYTTWNSMKIRCYQKANPSYEYYGGKGITICKEWLNDFQKFMDDMGERPSGKTIDRIDNSKNYTPDNCKWSTIKEQNSNKTNARLLDGFNKTLSLSEWAKELNVSSGNLWHKINTYGDIESVFIAMGRTI